MKVKGIICFGDSILAGTGASDRQFGCSKIVKQTLNVPVMLKGRNRDTSTMALDRITEDVLDRPEFSHVLVLFGNNDSWLNQDGNPRVSTDQFHNNIELIIKKIMNRNKVVLLCNLQPINDQRFADNYPDQINICKNNKIRPSQWHQQYSDIINEVAIKSDIYLIDIRSKLMCLSCDYHATDGLHPNDYGHRMIAHEIICKLTAADETLNSKLEYCMNRELSK